MAEETKSTKPADEEIERTAEPTAGEEKQPETEKAESDTAAAKEEQPEKKGFFGKKKEKKDVKKRVESRCSTYIIIILLYRFLINSIFSFLFVFLC